MDKAFVIYNTQVVTPEKMIDAINEKTSFGAELLETGKINSELYKTECSWLGLFCD